MKHVDLWVTLDMERSVDQAIVRVPRLDNWRRIIVRLRVGDAPYELPAGATAAWSLDRFGEGVPLNEIAATVSTMEVESGETEQVIVLQWDAAWTQISGAFRAIIHIVGSNNEDLWTPTFQFIVTESPYDDATVRQSPQFTALSGMKAVLDAKLDDLNEVFDETTGAVARAETAAETAEGAATTAQSAATTATTEASTAQSAASTAQSAATTATTEASTAQSAATTAQSAATTATTEASTAQSAATTATTAATTATTSATTAQSAATTATTAATTAQSAATTAQSAASTAQSAATTATTAATTAQSAATTAEDYEKDAQAWAVGKRGGADVTSADPAYHNNAKFYAEQAATFDITLETSLGEDSDKAATTTAIRAFVNSSINSLAAFYITSDASGNAFSTKSALTAGPWYYAGSTRTPTQNDYAIVTADETHDGKTARYLYTGAQWSFQYTFGVTFTQAQLDAMNSGITAAIKAVYDAHINNSGIHVTASQKENWNNKQDRVVNETVEDGLFAVSLNGELIMEEVGLIRYDKTQELTDTEKSLAKSNLGIDDVTPDWYTQGETDALLSGKIDKDNERVYLEGTITTGKRVDENGNVADSTSEFIFDVSVEDDKVYFVDGTYVTSWIVLLYEYGINDQKLGAVSPEGLEDYTPVTNFEYHPRTGCTRVVINCRARVGNYPRICYIRKRNQTGTSIEQKIEALNEGKQTRVNKWKPAPYVRSDDKTIRVIANTGESSDLVQSSATYYYISVEYDPTKKYRFSGSSTRYASPVIICVDENDVATGIYQWTNTGGVVETISAYEYDVPIGTAKIYINGSKSTNDVAALVETLEEVNFVQEHDIVTTGTAITLADNTIYNLTDVTTLTITFPSSGSYHAHINLTTAASGTITITLPASALFIGAVPSFGNGETWKLDIENGVVIAGKAVAAT